MNRPATVNTAEAATAAIMSVVRRGTSPGSHELSVHARNLRTKPSDRFPSPRTSVGSGRSAPYPGLARPTRR